jgi:hypothetical protein
MTDRKADAGADPRGSNVVAFPITAAEASEVTRASQDYWAEMDRCERLAYAGKRERFNRGGLVGFNRRISRAYWDKVRPIRFPD